MTFALIRISGFVASTEMTRLFISTAWTLVKKTKKTRILRATMISTNSHIALSSFLKATRFYQVGDHLICIRAVIICATLRDQMVIKSRGPHLEFLRFLAWLWTMHTRGRLKGKLPPLCVFTIFATELYSKINEEVQTCAKLLYWVWTKN